MKHRIGYLAWKVSIFLTLVGPAFSAETPREFDPTDNEISGRPLLRDDEVKDFVRVRSNVEAYSKARIQAQAQEDKVGEELKQLREAEAKINARRDAETHELEKQKKAREKGAFVSDKERAKLDREVAEKVRKLPGITRDELEWTGLED